jgi:hypothetical protein
MKVIASHAPSPDVYHDLVLNHLPAHFEIGGCARSLMAECDATGDTPEQCLRLCSPSRILLGSPRVDNGWASDITSQSCVSLT